MSPRAERWTLAPPPSLEQLKRLCEDGTPPPLAAWLHGFGMTPAEMHFPHERDPHPCHEAAVDRLLFCREHGLRLRIHGDYDADGVTAASILHIGLQELGFKVDTFFPDRKDGYGISMSRVDEHAAMADVFLTVDCGISNRAEVKALQRRGVEVIVTDHHELPPLLPDCVIVHPMLHEHFDPKIHNLTGAGVAYHLLWALCERLGDPEPVSLSALAAIGTVADMSTMTGQSRALTRVGLAAAEHPGVLGLAVMLRKLGIARPTVSDISFKIGPLINAVGRRQHIGLVRDLFLSSDHLVCETIVDEMIALNEERKALQRGMEDEARALLDADSPAVVLWRDHWDQGLAGLVAGRILEAVAKPVIVMGQNRGSVRSTPQVNAAELLRRCSHLLLTHGGHAAAGGFSILPENREAFAAEAMRIVAEHPPFVPEQKLTLPLPAKLDSAQVIDALQAFEPLGRGAEPPLWLISDQISHSAAVGADKRTLQFTIGDLRGVRFAYGGALPTAGEPHQVAARLEWNEFRGNKSPQLIASRHRAPELLGLRVGAAPASDRDLPLRRGGPEKVLAAVQKSPERFLLVAPPPKFDASRHAVLPPDANGLPSEARGLHAVLFDLPSEALLRELLTHAKSVVWSWSPETLARLAKDARDPEGYHRALWASLYSALEAEAWPRAVSCLLGEADQRAESEAFALR